MWPRRRPSFDDWRAMSEGQLANQKIEQHMDDCARRYESLRQESQQRYDLLRGDMQKTHDESQRRMDSQDKQLARIFFTILSGMSAIVLLMLEVVLRQMHF